MSSPPPVSASVQLLPSPGLAEIHAWLEAGGDATLQWLGPAAAPVGVAAWYRTHVQTVELRRAHGLDWLVLQTTFCARPRRRVAVLPMLAHANLQMESGRWFSLARPARLVCCDEQPAHGMQREVFVGWWQRFHRDAVSHGIELELRCRARNWLQELAARGHKPPRVRIRRVRRTQELP